MNVAFIENIISSQIEHLKNDPEEMKKMDMVDHAEYISMTNRNAFAIHQLEHLKTTIKEFIKNVNEIK